MKKLEDPSYTKLGLKNYWKMNFIMQEYRKKKKSIDTDAFISYWIRTWMEADLLEKKKYIKDLELSKIIM